MLTLPRDMQRHYFEKWIPFKDLQSLERVSKHYRDVVSSILIPIKINLVLKNPCRFHHIPPGELKKHCWTALLNQERLLNPYINNHQFAHGCPGVAEHDNTLLIALAGKVYFLISCNLYAHPIAGVNYKIELQNQEMKITDEIAPGNIFETFKASLRYNGINADGVSVDNTNSNNWHSEFQFLGKSLFGKNFYLKILPDSDFKRIFVIKTNELGVIQQVFTTVYESNYVFHMAPYSRKFHGSLIGIEYKQIGMESPRSCFILEEKGLHYWVFMKERKEVFRVRFEVKAIATRPQLSAQ